MIYTHENITVFEGKNFENQLICLNEKVELNF